MRLLAGFGPGLGDLVVAQRQPQQQADVRFVVRDEHATVWWRVSGDSLEAEGILDGDLIAVDRAGRRRSGRIVLALVDGQITVKKLAKRNGAWFLDPRARSDVYETIPVSETTEIWGVVAGVVRRLPVE